MSADYTLKHIFLYLSSVVAIFQLLYGWGCISFRWESLHVQHWREDFHNTQACWYHRDMQVDTVPPLCFRGRFTPNFIVRKPEISVSVYRRLILTVKQYEPQWLIQLWYHLIFQGCNEHHTHSHNDVLSSWQSHFTCKDLLKNFHDSSLQFHK